MSIANIFTSWPEQLIIRIHHYSLELELGELIHHQKLFGLFEAMSAIEMMDPKMDAGMCCNKNAAPLTYDVAVQVWS